MGTMLNRYRQLDYRLPATYGSWDLFGAGPDHLGRDGRPVERPLVEPRDDELLLRVDAIGLCFSDAKLIWAGGEHARIAGRDLVADPTVPGHEAAMTVARVGRDWKNRFTPGQRFIIQADVFVGGQQRAFGYVHRGAMAQFTYVGPEILAGDDGCYLLPMAESSAYAESALVEPWACVEDAYHIPARTAPKAGGRALAVFLTDTPADFDGGYAPGQGPATVRIAGRAPSGWTLGVCADTKAWPSVEAVDEGDFDDIFVMGRPTPEQFAKLDAALGTRGHMVLVGAEGTGPVTVDVGRVHYDYTRHIAAPGSRVVEAYTANVREELTPGGHCWMVGAAGPMGQMHMQRALELDRPPSVLVGTDVHAERLAYVERRLRPLAERSGTRMVLLNTASSDAAEVDRALDGLAPDGFDDVYVHAPVAALIAQASSRAAAGGVLNVFAGVPRGTKATLDASLFTARHARLVGSSGSSMASFTTVFQRMEAGRLATRMSLAALGGIEAGHEGILGVKGNRFPGKTVLFPALRNLPLTGLDGLSAVSPEAAAKLAPGPVWTREAEEALLESRLSLD